MGDACAVETISILSLIHPSIFISAKDTLLEPALPPVYPVSLWPSYHFLNRLLSMLQHWLHPYPASNLSTTSWRPYQYGAQLCTIDPIKPNWAVGSIALMGWGDPVAYRKVCDTLYALTANFSGATVVELGIVQPNILPLTELLDDLIGRGVFPIILSSDERVLEAQLRAQERRQEQLQLALVDAHIPFGSKNDLSKGLLSKLWAYEQLVGHTTCIGSQAYLLAPHAVEALQERFGELHRLGHMRQRLERIEPLVRQAEVAGLALRAIRAADAPAQTFKNPNGFTAEEACQIVRYMGMSDTLSSLSLYGLDHTVNDGGQTANLLAQLIWFAIAGHQARLHEYPIDHRALTAYVVENTALDFAVTFYKSVKSDRWWFKIPLQLSPKGTLIACSYQDYQQACKGELPDRLLLAIRRLT